MLIQESSEHIESMLLSLRLHTTLLCCARYAPRPSSGQSAQGHADSSVTRRSQWARDAAADRTAAEPHTPHTPDDTAVCTAPLPAARAPGQRYPPACFLPVADEPLACWFFCLACAVSGVGSLAGTLCMFVCCVPSLLCVCWRVRGGCRAGGLRASWLWEGREEGGKGREGKGREGKERTHRDTNAWTCSGDNNQKGETWRGHGEPAAVGRVSCAPLLTYELIAACLLRVPPPYPARVNCGHAHRTPFFAAQHDHCPRIALRTAGSISADNTAASPRCRRAVRLPGSARSGPAVHSSRQPRVRSFFL
jgi:hypothetical protein